MTIAANGEFWRLETPSLRARGAFEAKPGEETEVLLANRVVDDPRVTLSATGGVYRHGGIDGVKAFLPIVMQGQLDSGESVTLLEAHNYGDPGPPFGSPHYKTHIAVIGDRHVSGPDQLFGALRFRFGDPYWLRHLEHGETSPVESDGGGSTLSVESDDDGNWLVYLPATPVTLRRLETTVVIGCLTLAELALDQDFDTRDTQVQINHGDRWLSVCGPAFNKPPKELKYATFVPHQELTIEVFANWIQLNDTLDGLGAAVAHPVKGPLQASVLVITSLLEGLHRRLANLFQQAKFPDAKDPAVERIRQAARRAAKAKAADEENLDPTKVHTAVRNAVSRFHDVDYLDRATDVVTKVCSALPEIAEAVGATRLPRLLRDARNEMAHQLPLDHEKEPLEKRYLRWLVVDQITPWLLRGLLLLEAGIDPTVLHDGALAHSRFFYSCANVAQFVQELGWELPASEN